MNRAGYRPSNVGNFEPANRQTQHPCASPATVQVTPATQSGRAAKADSEGHEVSWSSIASQCVGGLYGGTKSLNRPLSQVLQ